MKAKQINCCVSSSAGLLIVKSIREDTTLKNLKEREEIMGADFKKIEAFIFEFDFSIYSVAEELGVKVKDEVKKEILEAFPKCKFYL